jgi:hypothetical protein
MVRRPLLLAVVAVGCVVASFGVAFLATHFDTLPRAAKVYLVGTDAALRGWPEAVDVSWPPPDRWILATRPAFRNTQALADDASGMPRYIYELTEYGWPMPVLIRARSIAPDDDWRGDAVGSPPWSLRISWVNCLVNVSLYFASLFLVLFLFPMAWGRCRMTLRSRRGLCPSCAYPLRGRIACPECGHFSTGIARSAARS